MKRGEAERPVGAGAVGTMGGDACVAHGEGLGKRSSAHAPSRINPPHVILSAAKDLTRWAEILRCAQDDTGEISMTILSLITIHRLTCIIRNAYAAWPNSITLIHEGRPEGE